MSSFPEISRFSGFDWDHANVDKNWRRHRVAFHECEEVFFHEPVIAPDAGHSAAERRFFAFGRTVRGRMLTVVFTVRENRIRVISARDMSRKERRLHDQI